MVEQHCSDWLKERPALWSTSVTYASRQGRWNINGLLLPDEVLRRGYRDNAKQLLKNLT